MEIGDLILAFLINLLYIIGVKEVYILFTHTGTLMSQSIRILKQARYSHVSIALDAQLTELYSFGRKYPYNAFIGRFVKEGIHFGTFKRFKNTDCKVMRLAVSQQQYQNMKNEIDRMLAEKNKYKFNVRGVFYANFNKKFSRPYRYYCSEFVKHILDVGLVDTSMLPEIVQPEHILMINNLQPVYSGLLRDYPV